MEKIVINTCVLHPARRVALGEGGVVPRADWDGRGLEELAHHITAAGSLLWGEGE